jgi:hypothetical protein
MDAKDADALREDWSLPERFLFYVGLRAVRRNVGGRERGDERARYRLAWLSEAKVLVRQIEQVVERYSKASISDKDDAVRVFPGFYSLECSVSPDFLGRLGERTDLARCGNALDLEEDSAFDLIITDPPYGFNTAAHSEHLAALYCDFIRRALKSLRDQGQLVIALPDQSFIGREPAFFANRKFVERQVTALAHELDLELVSSSEVVPASPPIYNAPYYWESERALRRSIIHYRIGSRAAVRERNDKAVTARI